MPLQIVPPHEKRNARWPLRRSGRGWETVSLVDRYDTAIRRLFSRKRGHYV
jgi:hypothetical protein